jgi:hypothetical protein
MCGNSAIVQNWINTSTLVDYNLSNIFSNIGLIKGWHAGLGAAMCIEYSSCFHILISSSHQVWLKRFVVYLVFFLPTIFWLLLPTAQAVVHHALLTPIYSSMWPMIRFLFSNFSRITYCFLLVLYSFVYYLKFLLSSSANHGTWVCERCRRRSR